MQKVLAKKLKNSNFSSCLVNFPFYHPRYSLPPCCNKNFEKTAKNKNLYIKKISPRNFRGMGAIGAPMISAVGRGPQKSLGKNIFGGHCKNIGKTWRPQKSFSENISGCHCENIRKTWEPQKTFSKIILEATAKTLGKLGGAQKSFSENVFGGHCENIGKTWGPQKSFSEKTLIVE